MRSHLIGCLAVVVLAALPTPLLAQAPGPQTYSYVQDPAASILGRAIVKVARDGPREAIDQILPVGPGRAKEFHNHLLYDFQAHKIYMQIVSDPSVPCSVMTYTSPAVPEEFDVITRSAGADSLKDVLAHATLVRKESVNGVPARVMEVNARNMKETLWVADPGGFPVKVVLLPPNGVATTMLEVKQLSLERPPASAFVPPSGCQALRGEATATHTHVEFGTGVEASTPGGSTPAAAPPPSPPAPQVAPPAPVPPAPARATAVELRVSPQHYSGACPVTIKLVGTLQADGPGAAYFQFQAGAVGANREGAVEVGADGTATVTSEGQVRRTPGVQRVRFLAGMEPRGHQENARWTDVPLDIHCTNAP